MKTLPLSILVSFALATSLPGSLKLPKTVYQIDKLAEACAEAEEEGKGLAFVMTDPGTT